MTKRLPVTPAPGPLEEYSEPFDELLSLRNQREGFHRYLEGLLLAAERNKTLTALANTEPVTGAQHAHVQGLQWLLSESTWDPRAVNARRLDLLRTAPSTAPDGNGVLVMDEHGKADPKFRTKLKIAVERGLPFRAVVAASFYGEDEGFKQGLRELGVGYILALKPWHSWLHLEGVKVRYRRRPRVQGGRMPNRLDNGER
ncbi:MAG: transposase [Chloroflexota bacterium]|nr:transposase [Chloroflexota bacterium]